MADKGLDNMPPARSTEYPHPSIGIIIAAFNAAGTLPCAIDSVLGQRYELWQVYVVDDGSTDGTAAIAEEYARNDPRIHVLRQANGGSGAARNAAIRVADTEYIGYLDADDVLLENHMVAMLKLMSDYPDRDIYSSDGLFVFEDGSRELIFDYGNIVSLTIDDLTADCRILGGGALVRAEVLRALGGFREHMYGEDYDLWLRALARGYTHVATPEPLYLYHRCVKGQKSDNPTAGYMSAVKALSDLIDSGLLSQEQKRKARAGIAQYLAGPRLEEQAQRLHDQVQKVFGPRLTRPILNVLHSFSWIVRPLRRWLAGRRS